METLIAQLNHVAKFNQDHGDSPLDALEAAAREFMLEEIAEEDTCRIYQATDGTLINAWIEGVQSDNIDDGGLGFDDQVEWYVEKTEDLITQAEAAELLGVSIQAVNNMIRDGRLRGYKNPDANQRQGRTLVSRTQVEK